MTEPLSLLKEAAHFLPKGVAFVDPNGTIQFVNRTWVKLALLHGLSPMWDRPGLNLERHFENFIGDNAPLVRELWPSLKCILEGNSLYYSTEIYSNHLESRWYLLEAVPLNLEGMIRLRGMLLVYSDITGYKELESQLKEATCQIRTLRGLLPICAVCKQIKDEQENWNSIEEYLMKHTHAEFTHDICPECIRLLYPQYSSILDQPNDL